MTDNRTINRYTELAPPQILIDRWIDLTFDLAPGHNVLSDLVTPETGGGFIYKDTKSVGSAIQNRFIYWKISNDIIELAELSSEIELESNQVRIRFTNSPILNDVNIIELSDGIVIMIATTTSVHRLTLPHPKTTNKSVLSDLTTEALYNPGNYHILSPQTQQPMCATSWYDRGSLRSALPLPDGSIQLVQFARNGPQVTTSAIKQVGIMGRLWMKMPNLLSRGQSECDNAIFVCKPRYHHDTDDFLLIALCRDLKIRIFSTATRECVCTHNVLSQGNFTQSFSSHTNLITDIPILKVFGSYIVIYMSDNGSEFIILDHSYIDGQHILFEKAKLQTPTWEKLIDFAITDRKIWALANIRETQSSLCSIEFDDAIRSEEGGEGNIEDFVWDFAQLSDDLEVPCIRNYVAEIFSQNRFSVSTVQKALVGVIGPIVPKTVDMDILEGLAFINIVSENQDEAWSKFYNYCVQNHHTANKALGMVANPTEDLIVLIKRKNPSFVCPWIMSIDLALSEGPYRGIEFSNNIKNLLNPLNYISTELVSDYLETIFEQKLFETPSKALIIVEELSETIFESGAIITSKLKVSPKNLSPTTIDDIITQINLDLSANDYGTKILQEISSRVRSESNPLSSNCGITLIYELFKRLVRARMILARDLLIYIDLSKRIIDSDKSKSKHLAESCQHLFESGRVKELVESLRCYATLVWISETSIKGERLEKNAKFIDRIAEHFDFYKSSTSISKLDRENPVELAIRRNLLMDFLYHGGVNFSCLLTERKDTPQTISNSLYITNIVLNLCRLLWPKSNNLCFMEYLFTHGLDEHLSRYHDLCAHWVNTRDIDRQFIDASNCVLQGGASKAVDIFNRLWPHITVDNLLGSFVGLPNDEPSTPPRSCKISIIKPLLIYRYYDKLIQLFQMVSNLHCLVKLINSCMLLLDETGDTEQEHWVNCLRAKLFQYHLELEEYEEAYHTMVLTTDSSLRTNCLRKFIVSHCEKEQWWNLISHPFIDIQDDFIDILSQKADSSDLSKLSPYSFYKTSYYDLLFAFHVSYEEYKRAATVMYNYAQRLAQEVPGVISIRKQADCLLIAMNALRCVPENEAFLDQSNNHKTEGRSSVVKRLFDCESEKTDKLEDSKVVQIVKCKDIELRYELTYARLRLLEKDQTANAIALSPLKPEETIAQLVASSMYPIALDLAILFRKPMEIIFEGLASKYVFITRLTSIDITTQGLEANLSDIFSSSYSTIDTYNCIMSSNSNLVDKLWRLIDHYLSSHDGIGHQYQSEELSRTFVGATVLMRAVAIKLLSAGYDIPASLKRMYMSRNTSELLKLLIKYDKLTEAAELAIEMINRVLEPSNLFTLTTQLTSNDPPPVTLPTHLIILLITYLTEDATNVNHLKVASTVHDYLYKYRTYVKSH